MAASLPLLLLPTQSSQTRSAPQTAILESENRESAAAKREAKRGDTGAEVRDSVLVVMAKEQWGKMAGRERIKTWGSFVHQATESPLVSATRIREARAEGLTVAASRLACLIIATLPISYLNTLFRRGGGGLKETGPI